MQAVINDYLQLKTQLIIFVYFRMFSEIKNMIDCNVSANKSSANGTVYQLCVLLSPTHTFQKSLIDYMEILNSLH